MLPVGPTTAPPKTAHDQMPTILLALHPLRTTPSLAEGFELLDCGLALGERSSCGKAIGHGQVQHLNSLSQADRRFERVANRREEQILDRTSVVVQDPSDRRLLGRFALIGSLPSPGLYIRLGVIKSRHVHSPREFFTVSLLVQSDRADSLRGSHLSSAPPIPSSRANGFGLCGAALVPTFSAPRMATTMRSRRRRIRREARSSSTSSCAVSFSYTWAFRFPTFASSPFRTVLSATRSSSRRPEFTSGRGVRSIRLGTPFLRMSRRPFSSESKTSRHSLGCWPSTSGSRTGIVGRPFSSATAEAVGCSGPVTRRSNRDQGTPTP